MTPFPCAALDARVFATLPEDLHYRGEPNEWVRVTRPGARLHSFLEAPRFDAQGTLWCVDVPYGRIFTIDADGRWRLALEYDGQPHGLAHIGDGSAVIADYRHGLMRLTTAAGTIAGFCEGINSERFRGLGDIVRAANGDLWFTDPGRSSLTDPTGRVYCLRSGSTVPQLELANVPYPNGVALSPDGKFVFVAATRANAVWRLLADAPDPVFPMAGVHVQLSGGLGPDGLDVNAQGYLAVAHGQAGRVWLFDALGDPVARIRTPGGLWTTAVAFDAGGNRLFITEAQSATIYVAELEALLREHCDHNEAFT
ncbi:MAG: SMP-30/gluconolactonase/LRE family protein [Casimicrobiaceae bacterium]